MNNIQQQILNINTIIADTSLSADLISNGKWKQVNIYRYCSDSTFWGCAHLNQLSKKCTANPAEAFIYILQSERIILNHFDSAVDATIPALINNAIANGYFENPSGEAIEPAIFVDHYEGITQGIEAHISFEFLKNGQTYQVKNLLHVEDIISVTAFANDWNNRQYFIESKNDWFLFGWATMA